MVELNGTSTPKVTRIYVLNVAKMPTIPKETYHAL
jgi:hypothetical protein